MHEFVLLADLVVKTVSHHLNHIIAEYEYRTKHYRHQYVIGDLQGCFGAFNELLSALNFDETQDKLWFAGDIVARGEDSLATPREAKRLSDIDALSTVLGNHDITLIATLAGCLNPKAKIRRYRF